MKRWEEQQRKKNYNNRISNAKPTLSTQPKKAGQKSQPGSVTSSRGFNITNTSVNAKVSGVALAVSEEIYSERQGNVQLQDLPIFQLLKAFKLQQYAIKLAELGYGEDIYKLALLTDKQRDDLIEKLKVLPGHNAKLMSLFDVIDELYPRKMVAEQIKQFTPGGGAYINQKAKGLGSNTRYSGGMYQKPQLKSLIQQYDALDPMTKQAFNDTFLMNLENAKSSMGQLIQQHINVNVEESRNAINSIFPPNYFGYGGKVFDQQKDEDNYNKEIQSLLQKYSQNYKQYGSKDTLSQKTGYGQARDLKNEMAQAIKDIDKINKELEAFHNASKPNTSLSEKQIMTSETKIQQRPSSMQSEFGKQEKKQAGIINPSRNLDNNVILKNDFAIQEAINILNDPIALSYAVKEQYEQAVEQSLSNHESLQEQTYQIQPSVQVYEETKVSYVKNTVTTNQQTEQELPKRPMSPLIDKQERDRLWNVGQSLDSKQVTSALGYLDLKQICYCLANALMKHIEFSKGFFFLEELQNNLKLLNTPLSGKDLEFTYNLDAELKIDIEKAKQKKLQKEEQSRKEFEELKKKMELEQKQKESLNVSKQLFNIKKSQKEESKDEQDEVSEEVMEEVEEDEEAIKDYYEDVTDKGQEQLHEQNNEVDEDIDFNYSQTHLEDFLKTQGHNTKNIQSTQLLNTFLSSYSKMRSGTGANFRDSQLNIGGTINKRLTNQMNPIEERMEVIESDTSEIKTKRHDSSEDEDEDLGRSGEQIDLKNVEVNSKASPAKTPKPILSQEEVQKIRSNQQKQTDQLKQPQPANKIEIDVKTKEGLKDLVRFQLRIFEQNYDFERDMLVGGESLFMNKAPTLEEIYYYCKYVIISGRMEKEIPILCLVYIERFLTKTGVLMNHSNWKRLTLISLLLASKIWDDDSLENVHFPQVMPDITLKEISSLEKAFLSLIDYDLIIRGSEYAKYYFILKTFAENFNSVLPMGPLTVEQMSDLQNNTVKAESNLRERYQTKLSLKKTMQITSCYFYL